MSKKDFQNQKIEGREQIFNKIIETFKELKPVAIHQFGSGKTGYRDEFSDIDLIITFDDDQIDQIVADRNSIYESIAPILIKHEALEHSPIGGRYSLVIHETEHGLFHVDYFLSKKSNTIIGDDWGNDAEIIYGDDSLPRGTWVKDINAKTPDSLEIQINTITFMCFIGVKGVIREWEEPGFSDFVKGIYAQIEEYAGQKLPVLPKTLSFELIYAVFDNIYSLGTKKQQQAIDKVRDYAQKIEKLYQ